jgi:hypothetical protein
VLPAILLLGLLVTTRGAESRPHSGGPSALWYRIEGTVTVQQKRTTARDKVDRSSTLALESNTAVILYRVGRRNFSFQAAASGEVKSHTGKGRRVTGVVPQCRYQWTETGKAKVPYSVLSGSSLRGMALVLYVTRPVSAARMETRVQCGGRCTLYNCVPPHDDPPKDFKLKIAFVRPPAGSTIRHPAGGFGDTRIVVDGTSRVLGDGVKTTYHLVFKRCPDQNLAQDCRV